MVTDRNIRDICLSIEANLVTLAAESAKRKQPVVRQTIQRTAPRRLSQEARDALELALSDLPRPFKFVDLVNKMNEYSPGCAYKAGDFNESIRNTICELNGLRVQWRESTRIVEAASR